jgi:hypothetical protein
LLAGCTGHNGVMADPEAAYGAAREYIRIRTEDAAQISDDELTSLIGAALGEG